MSLKIELMKLDIFSVGAVRSCRLLDPTMKTDKQLSEEARGAMDYRVVSLDGVDLGAMRRFDNSAVYWLLTLYECQPIGSVKRWSSKQKKHLQIERPAVFKAYNDYMGGLDSI